MPHAIAMLHSNPACSVEPSDYTPARSKLPKSKSFYRRLTFGSTATVEQSTTTTAPIEPAPSPNVPTATTPPTDEPKSVQSLKQFWYNAFGSVRSRQRRAQTSSVVHGAERARKCATLSTVSSATPQTASAASVDADASIYVRKCATLHRNFVTGTTGGDEDVAVSARTDASAVCGARPTTADASVDVDHIPVGIEAYHPTNASNPADNFYKYKTADMVRQQSIVQQQQQQLQQPSVVSAVGSCTSLHWARRSDNIAASSIDKHQPTAAGVVDSTDSTEETDISLHTDTDKIAPELDESSRIQVHTTQDNDTCVTRPATMIGIVASPCPSDGSVASRKPPQSSGTSIGSSSTIAGSGGGSGVTRKCSFRTNTYQPHSRKMTAGGGGSKVAALTHRFNQLCSQQQARDLIGDEMRMRQRDGGGGGMIVHRAGGRVFKVMKEEEMVKRSGSRSSADSSPVRSVRKRGSVKRKMSRASDRSKTAMKTVTNSEPTQLDRSEPSPVALSKPVKPKVPDKSAQVLQRTKEIARRNMSKYRKEESVRATDVVPKLTSLPESKEDERFQTQPPSPTSPISVLPTTNTIEPTNEENPKKNKYVRLYEKFRPSFLMSQHKLNKSNSTSPIYSPAQSPTDGQSVKKIIDAISAASQRIENLSKSESCLVAPVASEATTMSTNDEYMYAEHDIKPNQSFLYRSTVYNEVSSTSSQLVEAINTCVLTKAQSMDEMRFRRSFKLFPAESLLENAETTNETENDHSAQTEDDYEFIQPPDVEVSASEMFAKSLQRPTKLDVDSVLYAVPKTKDVSNTMTEEHVETTAAAEYTDCSDIYQSIVEVFNTNVGNSAVHSGSGDRRSINSYESFGTYQSVDEGLLERIRNENGYEICDPPDPPPEPPPPRQQASRSPHANVRQSDSIKPELPAPKRAFNNYALQTSDSMTSSNYEHIKYDKQPQRPPKSAPLPPQPTTVPAEPLPTTSLVASPTPTSTDPSSPETEYDEENIYDTIKPRRRCVTNDSSSSNQPPAVGIDYESIEPHTSFMRPKRVSKGSAADSDSMSTLSSDNKTNSLYGTTMSRRESVSRPPSEGGDNSDDWVDISDGESDNTHRDRFVVVCERKRAPRHADWCRKVRDQRQQQSTLEYYEDDSDHYYESLDPTGINVGQLVNPPPTATSNYDRLPHLVKSADEPSSANAASRIEEDYDSFDSDEESDEEVRIKNDSGVDVSNNRLPDPPTPTNQVYAFMQKIRNFGSLSKNLSKFSKKKSVGNISPLVPASSSSPNSPASPSQIYENTQFYVKSPTSSAKKTIDDAYENTDFHALPSKSLSTAKLDTPPVITEAAPVVDHKRSFGRKKSSGTTGKSFKSKFRKSLGPEPTTTSLGSSFNGKRSTFYVTDSTDLDSGVFTNPPPVTAVDSMPMDTTSATELPTTLADKTISPEVTQRKSSLTVRPLNPPPPPPVDRRSSTPTSATLKSKRLLGTTSWYAECGGFKANDLSEPTTQNDDNLDMPIQTDSGSNVCASPTMSTPNATTTTPVATINLNKDTTTPSSWYADAGTYQTTSGASVTSSSGSSGVSTGCSGDDHSHSMFLNEPLYQIYSAAKLESISHDIDMDGDEHSDGYEEVGNTLTRPTEQRRHPVRPTALQLVGPKQGPSRTLWCEIPEVINSQILASLTTNEKRLQEAKFEILTSEASYLKSLTLLRTHFMNHPAFRDEAILSAADRKTLFSYMVAVQECSDRLLCDLENCWQDNIMLLGLSHSVYKHAEKYFHVYIAYCEHQAKLDRTLKRLKEPKSGPFYQTLCQLETDASCCGLSLHSFLMLPMQRITRLPLLVDAVVGKLRAHDDDEYDSWNRTLALVGRIVAQCNEAANRSAQAYELQQISAQIEFPQSIRPLPIVPVGTGKLAHRALVRSGALTHIVWRGDDGKLTFGKRFSRTAVHAFLFTDLLVLARRRDSGGRYLVVDYCERQLLTVTSGDVIPQLPTKDVPQAGKHLVCMTLLENHEGKMTEMIFSCPSETDRQRWLHATEPPASNNPDEKLYEQWDCPQVMAKHPYAALQPDELSLDSGDVVNVTRKMADGWYQGERLRDGAQGWFPGNYTDEVASAHVRARNLKQRYRLITAAYWEAQKRK